MVRTLFFLLTAVATLTAQLAPKKAMTLAAAKQIAATAEAEARKNGWNVVIAVVDDGAHLVYLQRMDGTQIGSVDVALAKAESAVKFKRPTKVFEDTVVGGRNTILRLPGAIPVEGGLALMLENQLIGGIGVSGVTSAQDGQIAGAGATEFAKMK